MHFCYLRNGSFVHILVETCYKIVFIHKKDFLACYFLLFYLGRQFYSQIKHHLEEKVFGSPVLFYVFTENGFEAIGKLNIGSIKHISKIIPISENKARLVITSDNYNYNFYLDSVKSKNHLANGQTRYLSSEVAGGFTGVFIGLYAVDEKNTSEAVFTNFKCEYK